MESNIAISPIQATARNFITPLEDAKLTKQTRRRIKDLQQVGMPLNRITVQNQGHEIDTPTSEIVRWLNGEELALIGAGVLKWLERLDAASNTSADERFGFVMTPTSQNIFDALDSARVPQGSENERGIAAIFGGAGTSKTFAVKRYVWEENRHLARDREVAAVYHQVDGDSTTWVKLLNKLLLALGVSGYPERTGSLLNRVSERIQEGGIIILDEAAGLRQTLLLQLRAFCDTKRIALAITGNAKGYKKIHDARIESLLSRMGSDAIYINMPTEQDINDILVAWKLAGEGISEFLYEIAHRDGGLRYLAKTVREAHTNALAVDREIDIEILKKAAIATGSWARQDIA